MPELDLSVVIPAYKESENLTFLLPRLQSVLNDFKVTTEVIVVDTMFPMDDTQKICSANEVIYLNRTGGNFYGDAIRSGITRAKGRKIIFMDADGSHDPEFIGELLSHSNHYDVVIASRYIKGGGNHNSKILILMSWVLNISYSLILQIKCRDLSNSYKLYDAKQLKKVALYSKNFEIVEEMIYKVAKANRPLKIKEIPYIFKQRVYGVTKRNLLKFIFSYIYIVFRLRFVK